MTLMGIPIALWKKGMGTPVAVSIGIALCFVYLLILGLARTLGFCRHFATVVLSLAGQQYLSSFWRLYDDSCQSLGCII